MYESELNQLYKPDRLLYYMDATEEEVQAFAGGVIPERFLKYENSFGQYDYPGLFFIKSYDRAVLGIEYRIGDERIAYPDDLASIHRPEAGVFRSCPLGERRESVVSGLRESVPQEVR